MKKLLLVPLCLVLAAAVSAQTLKLASAPATKPFEPMIAKLFKTAGLSASFEYLPLNRLMVDVDKYDALYFLTDSSIRAVKGMVKVPVALFTNEIVAVAVKPEVKVSSKADLAKYKVGIERGNPNHLAQVQGLKGVVEADNAVAEFKMLAAGRFDVAVSGRTVSIVYAKEAGLSTIYIQDPPLEVIPLYIALTARAAAYEPQLTAAFRKLESDGSWLKEAATLAPK